MSHMRFSRILPATKSRDRQVCYKHLPASDPEARLTAGLRQCQWAPKALGKAGDAR